MERQFYSDLHDNLFCMLPMLLHKFLIEKGEIMNEYAGLTNSNKQCGGRITFKDQTNCISVSFSLALWNRRALRNCKPYETAFCRVVRQSSSLTVVGQRMRRMSGKEVKNGIHKGGEVIWFALNDMFLLKSNPGFEEIFRRVGCLKLCQKIDGHHINVSYRFSLNYDGNVSKVGDLMIPIAETNISLATGIPVEGEKWFRGTSLDLGECR